MKTAFLFASNFYAIFLIIKLLKSLVDYNNIILLNKSLR